MPLHTLPDGAQLHYEIRGSGEPLLLVTGTTASIPLWSDGVLDALAADHQVIAYDHRGMGGSSPVLAPPGDLSMASLARDAASLVDGLGVGSVHLVGWSLGSAVGQELALARPDLVASLVLYGTWPRCDGFQRALISAQRGPWAAGDIRTALAALGLAFSPQMLDHPEFEAILGAFLPAFPQTAEQVAMTVAQWDADLHHDTAERLGAIAAPTTVLVGEQDLFTPPWQSRAVADAIPGAAFELVGGPGSSHGLHLERPQDWLGIVGAHLARHARGAAPA